MGIKNILIKLIIILLILLIFITFFHTKLQIKNIFIPTENDIFDVKNPFFTGKNLSYQCYKIGECSPCPDLMITSPCDKEPRYRLNIHCIYNNIEENITERLQLPSWVSCNPKKIHSTIHFFMVQVFLIITSLISISFIIWRRRLQE